MIFALGVLFASILFLMVRSSQNDPGFGGRFILLPSKSPNSPVEYVIKWAAALGIAFLIAQPQPWMVELGAPAQFSDRVIGGAVVGAICFVTISALTWANGGAYPGFNMYTGGSGIGRERWRPFRFVTRMRASTHSAQGLKRISSRRSEGLKKVVSR